MEMPFGLHKGKEIEEIPSDYFEWLLRNCKILNNNLRDAIEAHLRNKTASKQLRNFDKEIARYLAG